MSKFTRKMHEMKHVYTLSDHVIYIVSKTYIIAVTFLTAL